MAISLDVVPKIDTAAFARSVKLGIAKSLLLSALDNLPSNIAAAGHVRVAITEIDRLTEDPT
jgi:hypothetical protein